ncbi:MAG: response regulator [Saprospiraceae bacterium]
MKKIAAVLLVDDDEEDRYFFREALREVDATVQYLDASDGQQALQMLSAQGALLPDLIFLDLNMPLMSGKQCLSALMQSESLSHIPVIVYTTSGQEQDVKETRKMGAAHFITKPALFDDICQAIGDMLGKKWAHGSRFSTAA